MNPSQGVISSKRPAFAIEWKLLVFLILFMDVKLAVKAVAILFIYILQPDFKFGFRIKDSRLPLFYVIIIWIALLNFGFYSNFSGNYLLVVFTGIMIWVTCILAVHQLRLFVEHTDIDILHNTLLAFFVLNIAFSLLNLMIIFVDIGIRNPFLYQGQFQKYFINTGDFIKGISADTSTTNAFINCFAVVYFLYQKKYFWVMACMSTLLLTGSNFSYFILLLVLIMIFLFKSVKEQKSIIIICIGLLITFFSKISPQNKDYVSDNLAKFFLTNKEKPVTPQKNLLIRETPDSLLSSEERNEKTATLFLDSLAREQLKRSGMTAKQAARIAVKRPEIPKENIHSASFQWKRDTTMFQRQLYGYIKSKIPNPNVNYGEISPGKILAYQQSYEFFNDHRTRIITGDGIGNFSSKLAFRATGLKMAGGFPQQFIYCNPDFLNNHLNLYAHFFLKPANTHSIIHIPGSVYDQMLTEYGILGIAAFVIYYLGFFYRYRKFLTYGLPITFILLAFFSADYWFEQLSVVALFELLMFINIKEQTLYAKFVSKK